MAVPVRIWDDEVIVLERTRPESLAVDEQWLIAALEEYKALRAEALAAIDRQQQVAGSGVAFTGVVLGIGAAAKGGSLLQGVLLGGLLPAIALFVVVVWLGEVERQVRAGKYLADLEARIGARFAEAPLSWESELRSRRPAGHRILYIYRSVVAIPLGIALGGAVIAVVGLGTHGAALQILVALADAAILSATAGVYWMAESRMRNEIRGGRQSEAGRSSR